MKRSKQMVGWMVICALVTCVPVPPARAQSAKAMLEQITALKAFIIAAEKGYTIAEDGLAAIRDIKNGEFNLHAEFFGSLSSVNPAVRDMPQVAKIISLQSTIVQKCSGAINAYRQGKGLSSSEDSYLQNVYGNLVNLGIEDISALQDLVTDGKLEMTDGERIKRIGVIDGDMQEQDRFVQAFTQELAILLVERQQASGDIGTMQGLYGIP